MEGTMDITSNGSNNNSNDTAAAGAAPHNQQQVQEEAVVSSPTGMEQAKNTIKKPRGAAQQAGGSGEPKPRPPHDPALSCPRCFSTNTKFCYYNNYNLNQPRYSCKTCRRYWTQGGSLRHIPVGGGFRRNKRASGSSSSSSSAASSNAATSAVVNKAVNTQLRLSSSAMSMPAASPTTGLLHNDVVLPAFTPPTDGSGGSDLAMDEQQEEGFLPFEPLSLSDQAPEELAPGESDGTMPTFLDMLTGGYLDGAGSSNSYGADPAMSGACNGMDMSFLLPEVGVSATDPMQMQMLEGMNMNDVAGELQWASSELDNYFNYDGGYYYDPAGPTAGVEQQQQQQVVGDQQQQEEEENKETKNSKNNNDGDGGSSVYSYWINTNNGSDGAQG